METPTQKVPTKINLSDVAVRVQFLQALEKVLKREKNALRAALFDDFSLPEAEFLQYEFRPVMQTVRTFCNHLYGWTKAPILALHDAQRRLLPRGAALIAAGRWEPLADTLIPLVGAIAAGCPVTLAQASTHQNTVKKIAEILSEVFPPEAVACTEEKFAELLQREFSVIYPGSSTMNLRLAKEYAAHHAHCTVIEEPQGVIPAIVDESAALRSAARAIVRGKFRAAGQTRYAPDFALVHHKVKAAFELEIRKAVREFYGDNPQQSPDYARIADRTHYETLCALMSEGNLVTGGECAPEERFIAPTVIDGAERDGALAKEPLHGPLLPIFEYDTFYGAMEYVKSHGIPPVVYFFGHSRHKQKRLWESVAMPNLFVNGIPPRPLWASYGGVRDLLEAFSVPGTYAQGGSGLFHPPFSGWKSFWARLLSM